jgi:hypothetical protein
MWLCKARFFVFNCDVAVLVNDSVIIQEEEKSENYIPDRTRSCLHTTDQPRLLTSIGANLIVHIAFFTSVPHFQHLITNCCIVVLFLGRFDLMGGLKAPRLLQASTGQPAARNITLKCQERSLQAQGKG